MNKESKAISEAIKDYIEAHDKNVSVVVSIRAFAGDSENCEIVDSLIFCYGMKDSIKLIFRQITEAIDSKIDNFIDLEDRA